MDGVGQRQSVENWRRLWSSGSRRGPAHLLQSGMEECDSHAGDAWQGGRGPCEPYVDLLGRLSRIEGQGHRWLAPKEQLGSLAKGEATKGRGCSGWQQKIPRSLGMSTRLCANSLQASRVAAGWLCSRLAPIGRSVWVRTNCEY